MRLTICFVFIWQALFIVPTLSSQINDNQTDLKFRQITIEEGLSSNLTYEATEDKFGFCWIATSEGLCRYDGVKFKIFKNNPADSLSLSQNHVRTVFTDSKGNVWVGLLTEGICIYDYKTGHFSRYKNEPKTPNLLADNSILSFFEDSQHNIWIGTEQGVSVFNPSTKSFTTYTHQHNDSTSIGKGGVINIAEDAQHRIWLATWEGGLNLFLPKSNDTGTFRQFYPLNYKHFWSLYLDSQNRFWVGSFDGGLLLMKVDNAKSIEKIEPEFINFRQNPQKKLTTLSKNMVFDIEEDNTGKLWVATSYGLNVFDPSVLRPESMSLAELRKEQDNIYFYAYNYEHKNVYSIPSHEVKGLAKSKNGIMWACTPDGLALFKPQNSIFQVRNLTQEVVFGFINTTSVVKESNGRIWYGTQSSGIFINMPNSNKYIRLDSIAPNCHALNVSIGKLQLEDDKYLWIGCQLGLVRMNLKDYSYKIIISNKNLPDNYKDISIEARDILKDKKGNVWFATTEGLFRYSSTNSKVDCFRNIANNSNSLSHNVTSGIVEDDDGNIWVINYKGVDKLSYNQEGNYTFINYRNIPNDPQSLISNRAVSICKRDGFIYIGTETGLSRTNGDGKFTTFGNNKMIGEVFVKSLINGKENYLWGACNTGLFRFDVKTENFQFFDNADGLHDNFFFVGSAYKSNEDELFFCGRMGAISFYEKDIAINNTFQNLYLINFLINNQFKKFDTDAILVKNIHLKYDENNITFEFSASNFLKPKSVKYAYKLEGYDKEWIFTGNLSSAVYTNLPGGDYIFKVKCSNDNAELVDSNLLEIPVHIAKPFWQETWFYVLCFVFICMAIYVYVRLRTKKIRETNKALNKEITERKKAEELLIQANEELISTNKDLEQFAFITSHDLQEPLRMVGNYVQLLNRRYYNTIDENGKTYIGFAVEGVKRMSELLLNILNFSKVGKLDIQFSDTYLKKVLSDKITDLQKIIEVKNVKLEVAELPANIRCEPAQIGMVFHHLINNAIKFNKSLEPKITIGCEELPDSWLFSIEDNGIGIKPEYKDHVFEIFKRLNTRDKYEGNGIGLSICKRIVSRHGGKIWFNSEMEKGTIFFFTISKNILINRNLVIRDTNIAA